MTTRSSNIVRDLVEKKKKPTTHNAGGGTETHQPANTRESATSRQEKRGAPHSGHARSTIDTNTSITTHHQHLPRADRPPTMFCNSALTCLC